MNMIPWLGSQQTLDLFQHILQRRRGLSPGRPCFIQGAPGIQLDPQEQLLQRLRGLSSGRSVDPPGYWVLDSVQAISESHRDTICPTPRPLTPPWFIPPLAFHQNTTLCESLCHLLDHICNDFLLAARRLSEARLDVVSPGPVEHGLTLGNKNLL